MTAARIWAATLISPLAWMADFGGKVFLVRTVNATGRKWPLALLTALALTAIAVGVWSSRRHVRRGTELLHEAPEADRPAIATARSVAKWGVGLGLFFALLVAAMALPTAVLDPRALP